VVTYIADSEANSFAIEVSAGRFPAAARWSRPRDASTRVAMSASLNSIPWNLRIGWPNCRSSA
jgi:hypothetical protein